MAPRRDDVALHVAVDFTRRLLIRNSIQNMNWGIEESHGSMPLCPGQGFIIIISCETNDFVVSTYFRYKDGSKIDEKEYGRSQNYTSNY